MRAIVFEELEKFPVERDVDKPSPGPGEVLIKVAGSGACHSDVSIFSMDEAAAARSYLAPPFILGHEVSGWVEEVGPDVTGIEVGSAHLIYGPVGCGHCLRCVQGQENNCENPLEAGGKAIGIGRDGGMAEYVVVKASHLVPLGDADPVAAAPLADAALTPYHAIKDALPFLSGGGKYALVIGLGGLGQIAVQILSALTGATIIATDQKEEAMRSAEERGAITVPAGEGQAARILELTAGRGVDVVFDIVGAAPTIALAQEVGGIGSLITVVGIAGGNAEWNWYTRPYEQKLQGVYWGTISDLHEVVAMYRRGQITPDVETYTMDEALAAYRKLVDGTLSARAVITPHA